MYRGSWPLFTAAGFAMFSLAGVAQQPAPPGASGAPPPSPAAAPPAPATGTAPSAGASATAAAPAVAATVDGQPILEIAVQRGLKRFPPDKRSEYRAEILNFLIDNVLLDQYVLQNQITVEDKEVDAKMEQVREAIKKQGDTFNQVLQELMLTEAELRAQITGQLRWDKFVNQQATDKVVREFFENNKDMFNGTMVHARHILLTAPAGDIKAAEQAKAKLAAIKKQVEEEVAQGLAKLPPGTDNLAREQARTKLMDETFAGLARKESACPSKAQDGDLGWFPRAGSLVEPFAKAAFALKPYELSDIVTTQFGYHLILTIGRKPGKEVKFDEVKDEVKEACGDRLREVLCAQLRPKAKIVTSPSKP